MKAAGPRVPVPPGERIEHAFEAATGVALPGALRPDGLLFRCDGYPGLQLGARTGPDLHLLRGELRRFVEHAPDGHLCTGFWGHGANTYAFYHCSRSGDRSVYLRLSIAGAYGDRARALREVGAFVRAFGDALAIADDACARVVAIDAMDEGAYVVEFPDGERREHPGALYGRADASERLRALVDRGRPHRTRRSSPPTGAH